MQKIHVRNIFKIFVPLTFPADYTLAPLKAPFGFALTDKRTLNYYQYHMQMFYLSTEKNLEEEAANCFAWGKRNPLYVKYKPNTDQIEGVILQVKVNHYVFDFRRIKERVVRVNVDCFNSTQSFLSRGSSALLKLLPKKRKNEDYEEDNEDEPVNINWEQTGVVTYEQAMSGAYPSDTRISPDSPINYSNSSPNSQSEHGIHSHESIHVSEGYEQTSLSFPDFPLQQQDEHYMVLYNGNAEVVGNFRALNFYKASDINIKEDIRLLSDDHDCRDTLMRINGVDYKFKPGVHSNVNKRFVGYIAQQVESVVPSAVQLIDGILHVDYESLIPYLSESIRQNFNDITNIRADHEKMYEAIDSMYEVFISKDSANPSSITPLIETHAHKKKKSNSLSLGTKALIICMAVAFVVAGAVGLFYWQHTRVSGHTPEAIPVSPVTPVKLPIQPLHPTLSISPQRFALQALYFATNGPHWDKQDNWLTDKSLCDWYGVQCSMFGEDVVIVVLANNNLNGTIPESINLLSGLRGLTLAYNNLHGTIPSTLYNMTQLLQIDLTFNNLVGTISPKFLNMPFLSILKLTDNKFSGTIPSALTYMTRISTLLLDKNNLTGTIPEFVPGSMRELGLSSNQFFGTLPDFSEFEELLYLYVDHNQLEGTISALPPSLRTIRFSHNQFNGTVDAFGALNRRSADQMKIDISHNQFTGDIGPLMSYPTLVLLDASFNNFTKFSTMLNNTNSEFQCHTSANQFACPLPPDADRVCGASCA